MTAIMDVLQRVKDAAVEESAGDPVAHARLLAEIHQLRLAAETPAEKLMRMRFEVRDSVRDIPSQPLTACRCIDQRTSMYTTGH